MTDDRRTIVKIVLFLTVVTIIGVGGNLWKSSLLVKTIDVVGVQNVPANQVIQLSGILVGLSMYDLNLTEIQRNVSSHYFVKRVLVERDLPGTVHLAVTERMPLAILSVDPMIYIDEEGVVLPPTNAKLVYDLPVISGVDKGEKLLPGERAAGADIDEAVRLLWTFRHGNRDMFHRISEVRLRNGGDIVLYSAEWGVPIVFGHGNIADKVARLEAFWSDEVALIGAQHLEYVDVRYEDQVIARWKRSAGVSS